ncbi:MAG: hypothetical protein ACRDZU_01465 [Acidimicrobiales bacterium]
MHIHHVIRGGLFATGVGIGTFCIAASAGAGSHGVVTAPAADFAAVTVPTSDVAPRSALLPAAPAAIPVLIEMASVTPTAVEEAEPGSDPVPEVPVIQAGPGPATPVPGAVTLIDPLVIERDAADPTA